MVILNTGIFLFGRTYIDQCPRPPTVRFTISPLTRGKDPLVNKGVNQR